MDVDLDIWPVFGLRVCTPRLELRPVDLELAFAVARLAAEGIHDPATMPFAVPFTDQPPDALRRESYRHFLAVWSKLCPEDWSLPFAVFEDGVLVGLQDLLAKDFPTLRTVETGSWLGRAHQGRGIGTEMRAAVLHLGFAGLGAERAATGAWHDNEASLGVTRRLGYRPNGRVVARRRGAGDVQDLFVLDRTDWETRRRDDITVDGLTDGALAQLGLGPDLAPLPDGDGRRPQ